MEVILVCSIISDDTTGTTTPWAIKKRATLFWTTTPMFLDGFQQFVHQ